MVLEDENLDDVLDDVLGEPGPRAAPVRSDSLLEKHARLAALRERVELRKQQSQRFRDSIRNLAAEEEQTNTSGAIQQDGTSARDGDGDRSDEQDDRNSEQASEESSAITSQTTAEDQQSFERDYLSHEREDSSLEDRESHVVLDQEEEIIQKNPKMDKRRELRERLREKEAKLEKLRKRTLLRKRPHEDAAANSSDDDDSNNFHLGRVQDLSVSDQQQRDEGRKRHEDHIKRLRMMTAKKRQDLARYKSRFASSQQEQQQAAEAF